MIELHKSRRTVVGGAVAGIAAIGAFTLFGRHRESEDGVARANPAAGRAVAITPASATSPEVAAWARAVGAPVSFSGAFGTTRGTIDMVLNGDMRGQRGPNLREQAFLVEFVVDRATAPLVDGLVAITAPIAGLSQLFVTRGGDRGAQATLIAVFN